MPREIDEQTVRVGKYLDDATSGVSPYCPSLGESVQEHKSTTAVSNLFISQFGHLDRDAFTTSHSSRQSAQESHKGRWFLRTRNLEGAIHDQSGDG